MIIHMDSQLIVQHIKGSFEVKDVKYRRYCELMGKAKEHFAEVVVKQVAHIENRRANELTQLASSLCD